MSSRTNSGRGSGTRLAIVLLVPALLTAYGLGFWNSVDGLSSTSRVYPQALTAVLLISLAVVILGEVRDWAKTGDTRGLADLWRRWKMAVITAVLTGVFVWGISVVGFYEALIPYTAVLTWVLGVRRLRTLAAFTVGTCVAIYLLFDVALGVRLPAGLIF